MEPSAGQSNPFDSDSLSSYSVSFISLFPLYLSDDTGYSKFFEGKTTGDCKSLRVAG